MAVVGQEGLGMAGAALAGLGWEAVAAREGEAWVVAEQGWGVAGGMEAVETAAAGGARAGWGWVAVSARAGEGRAAAAVGWEAVAVREAEAWVVAAWGWVGVAATEGVVWGVAGGEKVGVPGTVGWGLGALAAVAAGEAVWAVVGEGWEGVEGWAAVGVAVAEVEAGAHTVGAGKGRGAKQLCETHQRRLQWACYSLADLARPAGKAMLFPRGHAAQGAERRASGESRAQCGASLASQEGTALLCCNKAIPSTHHIQRSA